MLGPMPARLLWTLAACAAAASWARGPLGPSGLTAELPGGAGVLSREGRPAVDGGFSWFRDYTLTDWGEGRPWKNMVRVSYYQDWDDAASGLLYMARLRGEPEGVETRRRWGLTVHEATWKRGKNLEIAYIVELAPKRWAMVDMNCGEEAAREYGALFARLRDSLELAQQDARLRRRP